ncbi:MAG: AMP-binding protein [Limibaculum sp.]
MAHDIDDALLDSLNLRRSDDPNGYEIVIPPKTNIARNTVERYAAERPDHMALIHEAEDLSLRTWTFAELDRDASRLAHGLAGLGIGRGDRVALHTGMRPETGIVHMALYKLGAIAVTLSQLYGPDTLAHILNHAEATAIVTQDQAWNRFRGREGEFPTLRHRIVVGDAKGDEIPFDGLIAEGAGKDSFPAIETDADEVALLMYTSGSTGLPKGIMHGHRILEAYVPSLSLVYNLDRDDPGSVFWSPADWAWVGGLLDLLLIAWRFGRSVVTSEHRFDAEWAFEFMARRGVTHSFMTPTALKRLAQVVEPKNRWPDLKLRVVCTGGEALPGAVLDWAENDLGIVCNEFYGLTEVNHLIGSCKALYPSLPSSMGIAYPGHATTIVDSNGAPLPDGEEGEVVTAGDDVTQFLGYWKDPVRTAELRFGRWLRTGDMAVRDAQGYFWYRGRTDDLIKSSGFRIGPAEVEDCLLRHTAVAEAAVVASPDADRGSIVKAFIRLAEGRSTSDGLTAELQAHVKQNLAAYKYPREIEYVDSFELTSSGKISRRMLREQEIARKADSTQKYVSRRCR